MMRAQLGVYLLLSGDEHITVNGVRGFMDLSLFTFKHQTFWRQQDMKTFTQIINVRLSILFI